MLSQDGRDFAEFRRLHRIPDSALESQEPAQSATPGELVFRLAGGDLAQADAIREMKWIDVIKWTWLFTLEKRKQSSE